jgi:hypothetical protein
MEKWLRSDNAIGNELRQSPGIHSPNLHNIKPLGDELTETGLELIILRPMSSRER